MTEHTPLWLHLAMVGAAAWGAIVKIRGHLARKIDDSSEESPKGAPANEVTAPTLGQLIKPTVTFKASAAERRKWMLQGAAVAGACAVAMIPPIYYGSGLLA